MEKTILSIRVPQELIRLDKIRYFIDKRNMRLYKVGIALNLDYRPFLKRLNGETRFTVGEIIRLSEVLGVAIDCICTCDWDLILKELE